MTVRADSSRVDCRARFHFDGQKIGRLSENKKDPDSAFVHEEKLRFKLFPALGDGAVGVRDLPFAVAETADPYVEGIYWTAVSDGRLGLAVFNRGTMALVREADGGLSVPLAHAMHYIWRTRMLSGDFEYEFALYPFAGSWRAARLHRNALEYSFPPLGISTAPGSGRRSRRVQLALDLPDDVLVSAAYSRGGRVHVRLFEHEGRRSTATLRSGLGEMRLVETDLAGSEKGEVTASLELRPWQLRTVRMDRRR